MPQKSTGSRLPIHGMTQRVFICIRKQAVLCQLIASALAVHFDSDHKLKRISKYLCGTLRLQQPSLDIQTFKGRKDDIEGKIFPLSFLLSASFQLTATP